MSIAVLSLSHKNAPFELLEAATLTANEATDLAREISELDHVRECLTLATCNRVEVYLATEHVNGAIVAVLDVMARHCKVDYATLRNHLEMLLDDDAIAHVFRLAAGLQSMVLGEGQIRGQLRDALTRAQLGDTIGPELNSMMQKALKAGKRAHAETDIERFAPSVVTAALERVDGHLDPGSTTFLIVGAGTMSVLAVVTLLDRGVSPQRISVVNRAHGRALDLAEKHGITAVPWEERDRALFNTDVLITCTGAVDVIFDADRLAPRLATSTLNQPPFVILDLALPRDVAAGVRSMPQVKLIDLEDLRDSAHHLDHSSALLEVESIVEWDLAAHLASRREAHAIPAVVALHDKARDIVEREMACLDTQLTGLGTAQREAVKSTMQRVARKLIHESTIQLKAHAINGAVDGTTRSDVESLVAELMGELASTASTFATVGEES